MRIDLETGNVERIENKKFFNGKIMVSYCTHMHARKLKKGS